MVVAPADDEDMGRNGCREYKRWQTGFQHLTRLGRDEQKETKATKKKRKVSAGFLVFVSFVIFCS